MQEDRSELLHDILVQGAELLDEAESSLLELERRPDKRTPWDHIARCFHSIKGMVCYVPLPDVEQLCHAAEDLVGVARDMPTERQRAALDLGLEVVDALRDYLEVCSSDPERGVAATDVAPLQRLQTRLASVAASAESQSSE